MIDIDLMILFNGFIRNYINFGLDKNSNNTDIIKQENKYFVTIGKLLGFNTINKKDFNEISWIKYDVNDENKALIKIFREYDLTKDLLAIDTLLSNIKENPNRGYIQILETSTNNRSDFLNNIIKTSLVSNNTKILVIYITKDIIKNNTYYNAYLFNNKEIIKSKKGVSLINREGNLEAFLINKNICK